MSSYFLRDNRDKFDAFKGEFPRELYLPLNMGRYIPRTSAGNRADNSPSYSVKLSEWITWAIDEGHVILPVTPDPVVAFTDLTDVPPTYGTTGQLLRVNATEDGLEYFTATTVTDTSIYTDDGTLDANRSIDLDNFRITFSGVDSTFQIQPSQISLEIGSINQLIDGSGFSFTAGDSVLTIENGLLSVVGDTVDIELIGDNTIHFGDDVLEFNTESLAFAISDTLLSITDKDLSSIVFQYDTDLTTLSVLSDTFEVMAPSGISLDSSGGTISLTSDAEVNIDVDGTSFNLDSAGNVNLTGLDWDVSFDSIVVTGTGGSFPGILYAADYSADFVNRSLVDKEYVDGIIGNTGFSDHSIEGNGSSIDPFILVNDEASPGNWHYYGVDGISNKGWHLLPQFEIERRAVPSSTINSAVDGDAKIIREDVMQGIVEDTYESIGLAQPGTIFTTIFSGTSDNPTYQASGTDPYNPSNCWFWDGDKTTRIKELLVSLDVEETVYGASSITLTPASFIDSSLPTDIEISNWLYDNYTNNDLRLPNGSLVYYQGSGTVTSPDFIWEVIDDVSNFTGDPSDLSMLIKRIKEPTYVGINPNDYVPVAGNMSINGDKTFTDSLISSDTASLQGEVYMTTLPTYANEAAAIVGGLTTGRVYKTATGDLRIKL